MLAQQPFDNRFLSYQRGSIKSSTPRHHLAAIVRAGNPNDQMGQWTELIGAAAGAFGIPTGGAPNGGPSATGETTGMQQPGASTSIAVSPTFQTQISPQISPVFTQLQDSAGATTAATTTQYQPGGMSAEGGSAVPASQMPSSFPDFGGRPPTKFGGLPVSPLDPAGFTDIRSFPDAGSLVRDIRESAPFNWTPVYWVGGLAVVGVVALAVFKKRR